MTNKIIYIFGNEYLEEDSFAWKVAGELKGMNFVPCRSPDDLLDVEDDQITILDVVKGTDDVVIITDAALLKTRNMVSLHDFDLGFFLNLMRELGMDKKLKIIGVPTKGDVAAIAKKVKACI